MASLWVILTIALPWLGGLVVWLLGEGRSKVQHFMAVGFSVASAVAGLMLLTVITDEVIVSIPMGTLFGEFTFIPDMLGVFLAIVATAIGSLAVIFSVDYMRGEAGLGRYYSLVLLFIGAMVGLVLSGSLLALFLFWEITAFCSYVLISFHNDDEKAVRGGIKALVITQLGGIGLLVGALAIESQIGTYQISDFLSRFQELPQNVLIFIAFTFLAAAVAKSAQVPLQTWLPDAMEAPTPVSALIHAATMVNAGVYLLVRFYPAFEGVQGWKSAVLVVGLLSALIGGLQACFASDLKRALAYSTVSQLGFMVFAIGLGAVFASQFHLLNHSIFKALLFLCAGSIIHALGTRDMRAMGGLRTRMPFTFLTFLIGALALAGIPIANGFFSKELILEHAFHNGPAWAYLGILLATGMTALYVVRMLRLVFFGQPGAYSIHVDSQRAMKVSLSVLAFGALTSWLLAGQFSSSLLASLPYQTWVDLSTVEMLSELIAAPGTWITLIVIAASAGVWLFWKTRDREGQRIQPVSDFILAGLGFEHLNHAIVRGVRALSNAATLTQTGQLQWNLVGLIAALFLALSMAVWSMT
ncbi:MAG: NADH-quinone oxidoreductase subunit L [Anaerolineales bacterium]|nr:NADH-quinone oxidoreductase subunit L [Anaerolineales bacterium]